jgi:uncharacterized membrane protein (DUF485 family)
VSSQSGSRPGPTALQAVSAARWRVALSLTIAMMVIYFGFILLVAFDKPLLGTVIVPGLSLGMLLGVLVILAAWVLTWTYVRWANRHYDVSVRELMR